MFINKVFVFGNLTREPELRALPSGMNVASFSVATNRVFKDRDGKKQEQTDFHNVVVFGKQADSVSQHLRKGSSAFVEGRMQTRSWEKDGHKMYRTEIVADRVQFGPRTSGNAQKATPEPRNQENDPELVPDAEPTYSSNPAPHTRNGIEYPTNEINPDDIPF